MKYVLQLHVQRKIYTSTEELLMKVLYILLFVPILLSAQDINKMIIEEDSGKPMVIGLCDRTVFADTNFAWWFDSEYNNYEIKTEELDTIKNKLDGVKIKIILGTWCSDSRREVPRFLRILDELKYDQINLTMVCVNRDKKTDGTEIDNLNIELVPTFIIYRREKEIGRIEESPKTTLESDLKNILKK